MTPAQQRTHLRERKKALRAELERRKAEARARIQADRRLPEKEKKDRNWLLLLLLLLLKILPVPEEPLPGEPTPAVPGEPPEEIAPEPPLPGGRVRSRGRPLFEPQPPPPLPWIDQFRLQVAARSPRLSACFEGSAQPGTLRWTTSVEPVEGRVSDHDIEPTLLSDSLSREQKGCVLGVLSAPTYTLDAGEERDMPARVSMVIEF